MLNDDEIARRRFVDLFGNYGLTENDAAWKLFKAGWDASRDEPRPDATFIRLHGDD
jgi:hypothetical protein